ncbi:hypothetical protein TNCV_4770441 [Trichonephila clavipes]|nr:hypothetical protein TNCV_4770441 [Trichonephila clavipes]
MRSVAYNPLVVLKCDSLETGLWASSSVGASFHSRLSLSKTMIRIILMVKYYSQTYSPKNGEFHTASQLVKVVSPILPLSMPRPNTISNYPTHLVRMLPSVEPICG